MSTSHFEEMLEIRDTGERRSVRVKSSLIRGEPADHIEAPSFDVSRLYRHGITLTNNFSAKDAELPQAMAISKRVLANYLYSDVIRELDIILQAAYGDDFQGVVETAAKLRSSLIKSFDEA
jgi:hypothetical protein